MGICRSLVLENKQWETKQLDEATTFYSGGTPSKQEADYWEGDYPWVSAKDMKSFSIKDAELKLTPQGFAIAKIAPKGSVLVLVRGMTLLKDLPVGYVERDIAFNQDIKALVSKSGVSGLFLAYSLIANKNRILNLVNVAGHGTGRLDTTLLKEFSLDFPPLPEQCKIAEILSTWDKAIALLEQIITAKRKLKQGLMQQLLTGKKRFKEFKGSEWKTYHFKEIFKRVTRKNTIGNSNILTISGNHGLIDQRDFFNKRIAAKKLDSYYLLKQGEFAYNKSYSKGYPLGAIKRLNRYKEGVLSTLYICFKIYNNSLVNSDFIAHYFEAGILNKEIYGIAQEGARNHGLLNISVTDFFEILLSIPSLEEQQKIASILSTADAEISNLEKQLAAYKQQKRGLMQQLLTGKKRVKIEADVTV